MSEKYKIRNPDGIYFVTFTVVKWINVFNNPAVCDIILDSLKHCQQTKGLVIHAWCIMPNHIHMIIRNSSLDKLPDIIRDFRKFTSVEITRYLEKNSEIDRNIQLLKIFNEAGAQSNNHVKYMFWKKNYHPVELDSDNIFYQKLAYVHNNPVVAGIVSDPVNYKWSSAADYQTRDKGLLELEII